MTAPETMAQVLLYPAAMAVAPAAMTVTGVSWPSVPPMPSWPYSLSPQHLTAPETMAQLW